MIYTDSRLLPIFESQQYVAPDGTKYPPNYPKREIATLVKVKETTPPDGVVTGFVINDKYEQVWQARQKTDSEIQAEKEREAHLATQELIQLAQNDLIEKQIAKLESTGTAEQKARIAELMQKKGNK